MKNYNEKLKTDLKERAYQYALKIIDFIDNLPKDISTKMIAGQLLRSATSIGANIIEAQASNSK
ncbi:four helix bundle protein, partial [SCandidatus Aminicenantes bacterium Aminicenantia_JdfR_composite]|nr:four helix bundle protein [SCandidatus Aminicenantes bacterium Aminicenantia_JdfR_composite]